MTRFGYGEQTTAFLLAGKAVDFGRLSAAERDGVGGVCETLSAEHGVKLQCIPCQDMVYGDPSAEVACVVGHVVGIAEADDGGPASIAYDALTSARERVAALPDAVWSRVAESAGARAAASLRDDPVTTFLAATGPLAYGTLVYGVAVARGGDDDDDGDFKPDGAEYIVFGVDMSQDSHPEGAAGIKVASTDWDPVEIDMSDTAHAARISATAAMDGDKTYWLVPRYD